MSPNRTQACTQKHKHSADRRTLLSIETQSLPRDNPCADTREREAAALFSLMEATSASISPFDFHVYHTHQRWHEHGVARYKSDPLLARGSY
jgi:hypothetical protein